MKALLAALSLIAVVGLAPLCAQQAAPASQQVTQKFDYKPVQQIQPIQFGFEKIQVHQVVFVPASPAGGGKQRHSVPEAVLRIDNEGNYAAAVGVAIAIFDADGNLVAAGAGGTRPGWLAPGEREAAAIRFSYVYRNFEKARTFLLTMEVQKKEKATSAADPASSSTEKPGERR